MGDYIDRQAVFDAYEKEQGRSGPWDFRTLINSVPAADVAPVVHGRWKIARAGRTIKCSNCGRIFDRFANGAQLPGYCFCGAKMDKEATP